MSRMNISKFSLTQAQIIIIIIRTIMIIIIIIIEIINKTRRKTKFKMSELEYYLSVRVGRIQY